MSWVYLAIAICFEIIATSALQASNGFTKLGASVITVMSYIICFYMLSLALRQIPLGIAYAIWSGAGIVLLAIIGYFLYKQTLDIPAIIGLGFILAGVIIINVFSKTVSH
ncbi:multidrug efflux SMR transporter [Pelistega sp. NLN82]|uniref:Multidrug efflux SMR transporter n=1 Tax=Pelistega ratti TaxID=2652177 RepID=A0A6L9Y486_9BURK|nr:multidrug efflux SMR transporter [Pelistega ratti]NEN74777.1 multidrug efflux SMR transporter [Pelistega ratti]